MKRVVLLALLFALPFAGCKEQPDKGVDNREVEELKAKIVQKDSLIESVFLSLGEITGNLNQIKEREEIITARVSNGELPQEPISQIEQDIEEINRLLEKNREMIAALRSSSAQLKESRQRVASLESLLEQMTQQVEQKDREIAALKKELQEMDFEVSAMALNVEELEGQVDDLTRSHEELKGEIREQKEVLNTAYYIVGSRKELLDKEIIYKSGFIGRTLVVNENRSLEAFVEVDKRLFDEVIIGQKNIDIVTSHPAESYEFVMNDNNVFLSLVITDRESFWKYSKVLVISYK